MKHRLHDTHHDHASDVHDQDGRGQASHGHEGPHFDRSDRDPSRRGGGRRGAGRRMRSPVDRAKMFRAMHARRWMDDNPSSATIIAMLTEYQRDLEQEVANVADRIAELQRSTGTDTAATDTAD